MKFTLTDVTPAPATTGRVHLRADFPGESPEMQAAGMFYVLIAVMPKWPLTPEKLS